MAAARVSPSDTACIHSAPGCGAAAVAAEALADRPAGSRGSRHGRRRASLRRRKRLGAGTPGANRRRARSCGAACTCCHACHTASVRGRRAARTTASLPSRCRVERRRARCARPCRSCRSARAAGPAPRRCGSGRCRRRSTPAQRREPVGELRPGRARGQTWALAAQRRGDALARVRARRRCHAAGPA